MNKIIIIIVSLLTVQQTGVSQDPWLDSLKNDYSKATQDTSRVLVMAQFANYYKLKRPDSTLIYGYKALALARKINFSRGEMQALHFLAMAHQRLGNESKALQLYLNAFKIAENHNLAFYKAMIMINIGTLHTSSGNFLQALNLYQESILIFDSFQDKVFSAYTHNFIGEAYIEMDQLDSALHYCQLALTLEAKANFYDGGHRWVLSLILLNLGEIQTKKGNSKLAMKYFKESLLYIAENENLFKSHFSLAQLFMQIEQLDSAIIFANKALELAQENGFLNAIIDANILLSNIYENINPQQALQYNKSAMVYKDSFELSRKSTVLKAITDFDEQERQREIENIKTESQDRLKMSVFLGSTFTLIVIAIFYFVNSKRKQKAKRKIEQAYNQLKSTQAQLIQSEKMASLGELTAGIAHEIQNPLNFVNNFSEVSNELMEEMNEEIAKGDLEEAKAIAIDISQNLLKINHHGKRADAIVKGMLQHSRTSSAEKESTDVNKLVDEYLRLAYHGLRAKDKSFNAQLDTDFDENIDLVNIIPQDMGRVILNLITNAFYAVKEKKTMSEQAGIEYTPIVSVSTRKDKDNIMISVKDNGNGIPKEVVDKIFQPFFTTKPTGEGTGLGLSMSYDIVTKGHGGELKVETKEEKGTVFIIRLPV